MDSEAEKEEFYLQSKLFKEKKDSLNDASIVKPIVKFVQMIKKYLCDVCWCDVVCRSLSGELLVLFVSMCSCLLSFRCQLNASPFRPRSFFFHLLVLLLAIMNVYCRRCLSLSFSLSPLCNPCIDLSCHIFKHIAQL